MMLPRGKINKMSKQSSTSINFVANQPFLFIMEVEGEILALGRIKDPYW